MLNLKKISITGGVASGKTTVCRIFQKLGAFVVNADKIVHELLAVDTDLEQQIIRQFGPEVIQEGRINRKVLAQRAFQDLERLHRLERILHPAVLRKIEELYAEACRSGAYTSFVVEMPLLFEIGGEPFYDYIIAVLADERIARTRFTQAGFNPSDYDQRMKRQLRPQQKSERATYTIYNNGSLDDLKKQVAMLNQRITKQQP